jgi:TRAP-type C4-dicarboxylate transport system permease small subunit
VRYGIAIANVSWFQTSPTMEWSMGYLYLIVPASGAIMCLFALEHFVGLLRGRSLPSQIGHDAMAAAQGGPGADLDEHRPDQWL